MTLAVSEPVDKPVDNSQAYTRFLESKIAVFGSEGFEPPSAPHASLKPHQRDVATWAMKKGRAGVFKKFGLGKTRTQLQLMRWVHEHTGGRTLIVVPLGARQEFTVTDGPAMGMQVKYCRTMAEVEAAGTPYIITNYERVVKGDIIPAEFAGATLDEASVLRSLGSLTTQTFMDVFQSVPYRFVATATPSPNSFKELIHYAHFLGVADSGNLLTRFFQRNSSQAGDLTLMPSQEPEFWTWLGSWAAFVSKPSDLRGPDGVPYSDEGYALPPLHIHWHEVKSDLTDFGKDKHGQTRLLPQPATGLQADAKYRRDSLEARVAKAVEIVSDHPDRHFLLWHDLEDERRAIEKALPEAKSVYGSQDLDTREQLILGFANGQYRVCASKPSILGSGVNFQRHCADAVFVGVTFKFNDVIQACHRIHRYLQSKEVHIHFVYSDLQRGVRDVLEQKWAKHEELTRKMQLIVRKHGLNDLGLGQGLERRMFSETREVVGERFRLINNDCVEETRRMEADSVHEIVTSIPFGNHYEYSSNYQDFGHNTDDTAFFEQMDFLIPQLYRVLKPGRMACIHVKDRIMYGNMSGVGMYHLNPFSDLTALAFRKHGFVFCGRITIDTDVVRENAQTYRLGWGENAKDSTKMGVGSNEYVLLFRKWTPDMGEGTARGPEPVTKDNEQYTRSRWQIHASGIWRSSGDRLLDPDYLKQGDYKGVIKAWKERCKTEVYDLETHIAQCEAFEAAGRLPSSWMLFGPHSNNPDVWTDIMRAKTLNTNLSQKALSTHVCPLQLDVIERLIERYSNPGDLVLDPFMGVGSTALTALKMNRRALGCELNEDYWAYSVGYCEAEEAKRTVPTLFDFGLEPVGSAA